jgi:hypothetical protein
LTGLIDLLAVNVAYRGHVDRWIFLELRHIVTAALATAYDAELNFVIRAENTRVRESCEGAGAAQEIAPF